MWLYSLNGFLVGNSTFFANSQLTHGPIMPIFKSVQAIPHTDIVWKFEQNLFSCSQVIVHTNTKKKQPKLVPSIKLCFSGGNNGSSKNNGNNTIATTNNRGWGLCLCNLLHHWGKNQLKSQPNFEIYFTFITVTFIKNKG